MPLKNDLQHHQLGWQTQSQFKTIHTLLKAPKTKTFHLCNIMRTLTVTVMMTVTMKMKTQKKVH